MDQLEYSCSRDFLYRVLLYNGVLGCVVRCFVSAASIVDVDVLVNICRGRTKRT